MSLRDAKLSIACQQAWIMVIEIQYDYLTGRDDKEAIEEVTNRDNPKEV